jgi:hypothetical protein
LGPRDQFDDYRGWRRDWHYNWDDWHPYHPEWDGHWDRFGHEPSRNFEFRSSRDGWGHKSDDFEFHFWIDNRWNNRNNNFQHYCRHDAWSNSRKLINHRRSLRNL